VLGFLFFALLLLVLTVGPFVGFYYASRAAGWGLHRHPFVTFIVACVAVLVLVRGFAWLFPGCSVAGTGFHGVAIVHCVH